MKYPTKKDRYNIEDFCHNFHLIDRRLTDLESSGGGGGSGDGISPTVEVTGIEGGYRITITDVNGVESFEVMDGVTPVRGTDYWTEEDLNIIQAYIDDAIANAGVSATIPSAEGVKF